MNINKVLDELKQFNVSAYELKDMALRYIKSQYQSKYGICLNDEQIDRYNIDTIEDSINKIHDKFISIYGNDETALIFYHFYGYHFNIEFIKDDKILLNRYYQSSNNEIIDFIRYAINGTFDKNYKEINTILDTNKIHYDNRGWILNLDQIHIKSFKNGKVQITGLNQEQITKIKNAWDIKTKYQNIPVRW